MDFAVRFSRDDPYERLDHRFRAIGLRPKDDPVPERWAEIRGETEGAEPPSAAQ